MTVRNHVDDIDLKSLEIITQNARIPFKDVANKVGVSRAAVHQRVNRMIDEEVITGSGYNIDPKKVEYGTCSYMGIFLEKGSLYSEVVEKLELIPEIVECHYTTGQYAIFVKIQTKTNKHLKKLIDEELQEVEGIARTETFISLEMDFKRQVPIK